jgi:RNA polymerase sigma-70 factor (ECF subfamily)
MPDPLPSDRAMSTMRSGVVTREQATTLSDLVLDEAAFRDWYDHTLPRVYRYLLARCGGEASLAEELTQQTFIEAVRHRDQFQGRSDVVTWLCAIGRRKLVDHFRRAQRDERRSVRLLEPFEVTNGAAMETRGAVQAVLSELPHDQRLALVYRYVDELTVSEIAQLFGRSESAAESLLSRARQAFRVAYRGEGDA